MRLALGPKSLRGAKGDWPEQDNDSRPCNRRTNRHDWRRIELLYGRRARARAEFEIPEGPRDPVVHDAWADGQGHEAVSEPWLAVADGARSRGLCAGHPVLHAMADR